VFFFEGLARHGSIGRIDAEVGIPNRICTHEQNLCHHRFAAMRAVLQFLMWRFVLFLLVE